MHSPLGFCPLCVRKSKRKEHEPTHILGGNTQHTQHRRPPPATGGPGAAVQNCSHSSMYVHVAGEMAPPSEQSLKTGQTPHGTTLRLSFAPPNDSAL